MLQKHMTSELDPRRKRLLYLASYRGFKEADLLIGGFARAHLADMSDAELDEFEALLQINDKELYAWAIGNAAPPANIAGPVFERLKKFDVAAMIHGKS